MFKRLKPLAGLLIGGGLLAAMACGGGDDPTATTSSAPTATTAPGTTPAATAAPTATTAPSGDDVITAPDVTTPDGTAVIAFPRGTFSDQNGRLAAQGGEGEKNTGIGETLFKRSRDDEALPWIGTGWTVSSDLSSATVTIQEGIPFQPVGGNDFGELTAEDVAWSMNDANGLTNPESIHGQAGDFAGLWGEWRVTGDYEVSFDFIAYDATWNLDYVNQSGQAFVVFSKNAFDTMGAEWVRNNIVATGPYMVEEWLTGESYTIANWGGEHWKNEPLTDRIQLIAVQEPSQRLSLLRTGQVDAAHLEPKDAGRLDDTFGQASTGGAVQLGIFFSGNLWETENASTGEPIRVPSGETCVHDLAWIGCPGIHDTNAGDGIDDLQQAANIRRALALAIDRETVNDQLLSGLGVPVHVEYFSINHPRWDSKWEYPYDPQGAIDLILAQDPDYQKGGLSDGPLGGHSFEIGIYAGPELGGGAGITGEVADAVAGYWNEIGLNTFSLKFAYTTFRPTVVGRSNTIPFMTSCDKGRESKPWHFPSGLVQTSLTRGGFSCGFESPVILELYQRMATAADQAEALAASDEYLNYVYDQALQPGVVGVPDDYFFNEKKIASWPMEVAAATNLNSLWMLELQ